LRLRDNIEPLPPSTISVRLNALISSAPTTRTVLLNGQVRDLALLPFQRLNAHLVVTDGQLETTIAVQNMFAFRVEWLLGQRDVPHIAVLYYQPTPGTLVLESVHVPHFP